MQHTSELYQSLLADPRHRKECKIVIAGEEYGEDRIVFLSTSGGLFERDSVCIGSAVSREIELLVREPGGIPRGAKLCPWYRLILDGQVSEWVQRGTFYIDTRETNRTDGVLTIHGFDGIMLAEQPWKPDQSLKFPMPMDEAAAVIAGLLGTELDQRTKLRSDYFVDYPTDDYTLRDVLRFIAAAHGGNWTMTEAGKLRLVGLRDLQPETNLLVTEMGQYIIMGGVRILVGPAVEGPGATASSDKVYVGRKAADVQSSVGSDPISRIIINVDDENYFEAGDDGGQALEVTCPYGTKAMANDLLAELGGYAYRPLQAQDALIDPAVELGDGVTVDGLYILLAQMDTTFDRLMPSDIGAPGQREIESEIGTYVGQATREINRKIAQARSSITKTAEEIRLEVANEIRGLSASITVQLDSVTQRVQGLDGKYAEVKLTLDGLTISGPGGQTLIKGSSIDTGSIVANSITADKLNIRGSISFADLEQDVIEEITSGITKAQANTLITNRLVSSPTIIGADIYFGNTGASGNLSYTTGYDGKEITDLIQLGSTSGIEIVASTNIRLSPGNGFPSGSGDYGIILDADIDKILVRSGGVLTELRNALKK